MNSRTRKFTLIAATALLGALCLLCLWGAATNYWTYLRMRTLPVEVVAAKLVIDEFDTDYDEPARLAYILKLDLAATGETSRFFTVEEFLRYPTHPEEALDELAAWSPGTRHSVYLIRGDAREVRLPGGSEFAERTTGNACLVGAIFFGLFAVIIFGVFQDNAFRLKAAALRRFFSIATVFYGFSAMFALLTVFYLWDAIPKRIAGPNTLASISPAPTTYPPEAFSAQVSVTPNGRKQLDAFQLSSRRLLTFPWNGSTLHGGLGQYAGAYNELAEYCPESASSCRFDVNPADRWDVSPAGRWDVHFFLPLFLLLVFTAGLGIAGRHVPSP